MTMRKPCPACGNQITPTLANVLRAHGKPRCPGSGMSVPPVVPWWAGPRIDLGLKLRDEEAS